MPALFRPASLYFLASYLLISSLPFFPLLLGQAVEKPFHLLAMETVSWLGFWALLQKPRWFHYLLLPVFLAVPTEIYLRLYFGQGISTHHLGIILETSPKEAMEFLGNKVWLLLLVAVAVTAWWWSLLRIALTHSHWHWTHRSRWLVLALIIIGVVTWNYGQQIGMTKKPAPVVAAASTTSASATDDDEDEEDEASQPASADAKTDTWSAWGNTLKKHLPRLPYWAEIPYDEDTYMRSWPFGLALRANDFWKERDYLSRLSEKSRDFHFQAHLDGNPELPQTIVMVIGESSRFDRWSLNGYNRDTNPLLRQEGNLVSFSDVVTAVSATRLSVPIIVSRKPAAQSLKAGFAEKSFLSAFKEAGFKTYWLSNQMSFGQFDTPTSVFAKEADVTQFLNLGGFTNNSNLDQVLLEPMANAMRDKAPKKLIVLHTLGNHWNYSHRHPPAYNKWKPSLSGVVNPAYTDLKNKEAINNSYDNSILYTDWMLSEVIQQLKSSQQITSLFYISDHGQTLYDGSCNLAFHGHNTQFEFHVPAFIWYSDAYQEQFPDKVVQIRLHKNARLSTENVFHSLLDMANIRYPDEKLEWSILSRQLKPHTRYVDSYGWTNYDDATMKGDCREVIDKKTPLVQEK